MATMENRWNEFQCNVLKEPNEEAARLAKGAFFAGAASVLIMLDTDVELHHSIVADVMAYSESNDGFELH